jgi:hypothetical protein
MTNHHVVNGADKISILTNDQTTYEAALIGSDKRSDLALLKIKAKNLPVVKIAAIDPTPTPGARQGKRLTESRARCCTRFAQAGRCPPRLRLKQRKQYHPEPNKTFQQNPVLVRTIDLTSHGILPMHSIGCGWLL